MTPGSVTPKKEGKVQFYIMKKISNFKCGFSCIYSSLVSIAVIKHSDGQQLVEGRNCLAYTSRSQSTTEGRQDRKLSRIPAQGP